MLTSPLSRIKRRYKYARWYLTYRVWHNFGAAQRAALRSLADRVESFERGALFAVGNDGLIYDGVYRAAPGKAHVLKVALNDAKRSESFGRVMKIVAQAQLPFMCAVPEYGVDPKDPAYWYQVQRKIDGLMVSRYLQLSLARRLDFCDPVTLCIDLLEQTRALHDLRIVAPNVDAENVLIQPDRSLVRIDLDPYLHVQNGKLPRYPLRRLFRLLYQVLSGFVPAWRYQIANGLIACDPAMLDRLLSRLHSSALYGYDDPNAKRHRTDRLVDPADCFNTAREPLSVLHSLRESLEIGSGMVGGDA